MDAGLPTGVCMGNGFPRLLGDIGGTNARWAWQADAASALTHRATYACADHDSVLAVIQHYLAVHGLAKPANAALGIATAVTGDHIQMTNLHWSFSVAELRAALGVDQCLVLNDFATVAASLPALGADDVRALGSGAAQPGEPMAVLGPGTGLGVAGLVFDSAGRPITVAGEGGHATLAAANDREAAVLAQLHAWYGHASAERALSGPGLVNLYKALCAVDQRPVLDLKPADVSARAQSGGDAACTEALALFAAFLGSVAGNVALTFGARGGVFVGGGIVPRLGEAFDAQAFRERFEAKGRFRSYLQGIPTAIITSPSAALLGAQRSLDNLKRAAA